MDLDRGRAGGFNRGTRTEGGEGSTSYLFYLIGWSREEESHCRACCFACFCQNV
uniref:Uncharacterized protein n=1 Tax=Anguilla anguilla TaxID=7936 RepID=A0A0E9VQI1_ANGAN